MKPLNLCSLYLTTSLTSYASSNQYRAIHLPLSNSLLLSNFSECVCQWSTTLTEKGAENLVGCCSAFTWDIRMNCSGNLDKVSFNGKFYCFDWFFHSCMDTWEGERGWAYKDPHTHFPLSLGPPLFAYGVDYLFLIINERVGCLISDGRQSSASIFCTIYRNSCSGNNIIMFCNLAFFVFSAHHVLIALSNKVL